MKLMSPANEARPRIKTNNLKEDQIKKLLELQIITEDQAQEALEKSKTDQEFMRTLRNESERLENSFLNH